MSLKDDDQNCPKAPQCHQTTYLTEVQSYLIGDYEWTLFEQGVQVSKMMDRLSHTGYSDF